MQKMSQVSNERRKRKEVGEQENKEKKNSKFCLRASTPKNSGSGKTEQVKEKRKSQIMKRLKKK